MSNHNQVPTSVYWDKVTKDCARRCVDRLLNDNA